MARAVKEIFECTATDNLTVAAVITRLCDAEKDSRIRSSVDRRIKDARFPEVNTVDAFDFDLDPGRPRRKGLSGEQSLTPSACSGRNPNPVRHRTR
jgi:hypothetical protein